MKSVGRSLVPSWCWVLAGGLFVASPVNGDALCKLPQVARYTCLTAGGCSNTISYYRCKGPVYNTPQTCGCAYPQQCCGQLIEVPNSWIPCGYLCAGCSDGVSDVIAETVHGGGPDSTKERSASRKAGKAR